MKTAQPLPVAPRRCRPVGAELGRLSRKRDTQHLVPGNVGIFFAIRKDHPAGHRAAPTDGEAGRRLPVFGSARRGRGLAALASRLGREFPVLREGSFRGGNALTALACDFALFLGAHRREAAFRCRSCARHCMPPWAVDLIATSTAYSPESSAEKRDAIPPCLSHSCLERGAHKCFINVSSELCLLCDNCGAQIINSRSASTAYAFTPCKIFREACARYLLRPGCRAENLEVAQENTRAYYANV
jgi:hypothetical protein